jgi:hypothetical protein
MKKSATQRGGRRKIRLSRGTVQASVFLVGPFSLASLLFSSLSFSFAYPHLSFAFSFHSFSFRFFLSVLEEKVSS